MAVVAVQASTRATPVRCWIAQARAAYRDRYEDLEQAIADAEADNDTARAEKARAEREQLADELARGVGLGGRERRAGAAAERARVNVQRRLKDALDRIAAADPELGRHLGAVRHAPGPSAATTPDRAGPLTLTLSRFAGRGDRSCAGRGT